MFRTYIYASFVKQRLISILKLIPAVQGLSARFRNHWKIFVFSSCIAFANQLMLLILARNPLRHLHPLLGLISSKQDMPVLVQAFHI